jgi:deoxyribodipyrimidine photo-lyase
MHNYMRMLWGKRVIGWTSSPRVAYETLVELNNKYALDGRNPNSYSGIGWCFGRYDRPWGPERSVYGLVRFMSSDSARRKLRLKEYLKRWG